MRKEGPMAEKRKVLLVSYYFAPQNTIGAIRPTKLAKYLARMGHEVTVLCGMGIDGLLDPTLEADLAELQDVHVVEEWTPLRAREQRKRRDGAAATASGATMASGATTVSGATMASAASMASASPQPSPSGKPGRARQLLRPLVEAAYLLVDRLGDRSFARRGWREVRSLARHFDVVLSSYGPPSVLQIARKAKKAGVADRWIADFRDEVRLPFGWQRALTRHWLRQARGQADGITAVSGGVLQMMGLADVGHHIPNGFDREDLLDLPEARLPGRGKLNFLYCGQMYGGTQDLTPFFAALAALMREGALESEEVRVYYAGAEGAVFLGQARAAQAEAVAVDLGLLDRGVSLAYQKQADVLLLASWNTRGRTGVLTGKMLEYMMMDKPMVACVAGELPGSETKRMMDRLGLGFCYEAAGGEAAKTGLAGYLRQLVQHAQAESALPFAPRRDEIEAYAYRAIAGQFAALMELPDLRRGHPSQESSKECCP